MMTPSAQIKAIGVVKTYKLGRRSVEVLRGIDFSVEKGEFVALRGASGAGKSTLLHLLGGLDTPERGDIHFGDRELTKMSLNNLAKWRSQTVGFIFQSYYLLPELDALENVCLPGRLARRSADAVEARARELLTELMPRLLAGNRGAPATGR